MKPDQSPNCGPFDALLNMPISTNKHVEYVGRRIKLMTFHMLNMLICGNQHAEHVERCIKFMTFHMLTTLIGGNHHVKNVALWQKVTGYLQQAFWWPVFGSVWPCLALGWSCLLLLIGMFEGALLAVSPYEVARNCEESQGLDSLSTWQVSYVQTNCFLQRNPYKYTLTLCHRAPFW